MTFCIQVPTFDAAVPEYTQRNDRWDRAARNVPGAWVDTSTPSGREPFEERNTGTAPR